MAWWLQIKSVFTLASFWSASLEMWLRYDDQRTDTGRSRLEQVLRIVGEEQPPQPAAPRVSSLRDAKLLIVHKTLPWSAFKRFLIICALINGQSDCRSSGENVNTVPFWITWRIFKKKKQTLLSPSAKTTWLLTNKWATVVLMDFRLLDILPVWNQTKSRKKRTQSSPTRHWFGPEQGVKTP